MLRPRFTSKQYEDLSVFREHIDNLIGCISMANGQVIDLQPLFFRFTLDTTTAFLFRESVYSLKTSEKAAKFEAAFNLAQSYVAKRFRLLDLYWLIGGKEFSNACTSVHKFADDILGHDLDPTKGSQERYSRYTFLDALAQNCPNRQALRHQVLNILIAGRDTTACLLSWTL
jgi:cytochrome P450